MGGKVYVWGLIACIAVLSAAAYQQGNIVFDAPGWNVSDQYSNRQAFEKGGIFLDVRASTGRFVDAHEFAADLGAKVESETNGTRYEAIIVGKDIFYIFERLPYEDRIYLLTMSGDPAKLSAAKAEMKKILDSVSFSAESRVIEAPWEKPLTEPQELPFLTRHPVPWGWLVFWLIVGLLVWWRVQRRRNRKAHKHEEK